MSEHNINPKIIKALKTQRKRLDLSITQLCKESGISRQTWYNVIDNTNSIQSNKLDDLFNTLGLDYNIFRHKLKVERKNIEDKKVEEYVDNTMDELFQKISEDNNIVESELLDSEMNTYNDFKEILFDYITNSTKG